jgi:hypothetical protein
VTLSLNITHYQTFPNRRQGKSPQQVWRLTIAHHARLAGFTPVVSNRMMSCKERGFHRNAPGEG